MSMTSNRPYLLKAMYDWICDNRLTVHLLVNVSWPGVSVPMEFVEDGQIVLNITPGAVQSFRMDMDAVSFAARFRGIAREVVVPVEAVLAIFAKENGQGMAFDAQPAPETPPPAPIGGKAHLKVVK
jgi:stringent starvation protein B